MKSFYAMFLFSIFLFSSCTKDENLFIPDQEQKISQSYLHNRLSLSQSNVLVTILDDKPNYVSSNGKFLVHIPANSLQDEQNKPFAGQIKLQFNKLGNDKSDFIVTPTQLFDGQTSHSDTYTFKITSKDGGLLKISKPIEVYIGLQESTNTERINLYNYNVKKDVWDIKEQNLMVQNFEIAFNETTYKVSGIKSIISTTEQTFSISQLTNIGGNQSTLSVNLDSKFTATNTLAYFRSNDGTNVIQLNSFYKGNFISPFFIDSQNLEGQIITISDIGNENYFFGRSSVKIGTGKTEVKVEMQNLSIEDIKAVIQAL